MSLPTVEELQLLAETQRKANELTALMDRYYTHEMKRGAVVPRGWEQVVAYPSLAQAMRQNPGVPPREVYDQLLEEALADLQSREADVQRARKHPSWQLFSGFFGPVKPKCPYGAACYRTKNKLHMEEFQH